MGGHMWLVVAAVVAWAGETTVSLPSGSQRLLKATLADGWAVSTDTATKKCWTRGSVAEMCLYTAERAGRAPQAIIDAEKAGLTIKSCDAAQSDTATPIAAGFQVCRVKELLQDQTRAWRVIADGTTVGIASFKLTSDDKPSSVDGDRFLTSFTMATPDAAATRGTPTCAALETVLGASVDRFASLKGAVDKMGGTTSTLTWPGSTFTPQIVEKGGKASFRANLGLMLSVDAAQGKTQAVIADLAACDTWCAPITVAQTVNQPRRIEVAWTRADATQPAPRCAGATVRAVLQIVEDNNASLDLFVDAP